MPTQPQDRKPKKSAGFQFTDAAGKSHTLPLVTEAHRKMTGRDLRDAALGGEIGQLAYLLKAIEATEPSRATLDALYDMSQEDMMDVLKAWGEHGDGSGASLGESSGSSS